MAEHLVTPTPYIVKRSIRVAGLAQGQDVTELETGLSAQQGIIDVSLDARRKRLRIRYDVKQLLFDDVMQLLSTHRVVPATHGWRRLKYGWYRLLDENARDNANRKAGPCCSNPTEIYARRNRRG